MLVHLGRDSFRPPGDFGELLLVTTAFPPNMASGNGGASWEPIVALRQENREGGTDMSVTVDRLYRYPVKGLSPESLSQVNLERGDGLPGDRRYALARAGVAIDPTAPEWMPKRNFLMLALNARLAVLETRFDADSHLLEVRRAGHAVAHGRLSDPLGRAVIEDFFAAFLGAEAGGKPRLVAAPTGHMFSDCADKVVSLIGLASVEDLARIAGQPVDPLRFRANLYIAGTPAWQEFAWVGRSLRIGGARLTVTTRIDRCAATTVNPATGERDIQVPKLLRQGFGHIDLGVYARVESAGGIAVGDTIELES